MLLIVPTCFRIHSIHTSKYQEWLPGPRPFEDTFQTPQVTKVIHMLESRLQKNEICMECANGQIYQIIISLCVMQSV